MKDRIDEEIKIVNTIQEFEELEGRGKSFRIAHSPLWFAEVSRSHSNDLHEIFNGLEGKRPVISVLYLKKVELEKKVSVHKENNFFYNVLMASESQLPSSRVFRVWNRTSFFNRHFKRLGNRLFFYFRFR